MNDLDRASRLAWGPVRAVLEEEFSFSQIKTTVGLAGLDVSRLSHLSQKGSSYTSKGELMNGIDRLFLELSSDAAERFVRTVAEEICERSETGRKKLEDYCEKYGYSYADLKIGREKDLGERSSQSRIELFLTAVTKLLEELSTLWDEFKSQPERARLGREKLRLWKDNAVKVLNEYSPEKATTLWKHRYGEKYTGDRAEYKTFQSGVEVYKDFLIALRDDIMAHPDYWSQQISASKMVILAKLGDIEPLVYKCAYQVDLQASAAHGRPDWHMGEWNEAGIRLDMQAGQTKRRLATVELQQLGDKVKYALVPKVGITGEEQQRLYTFHDSLVTEIAQFDSSEFSASALKGTVSMVDKTKVFVVHGRNEKLRQDMFAFLRSVGLEPIEWGQAKHLTGKPSPYNGEILDVAFRNAQAIVVMLTPDDEARLREELRGTSEPDYEINLTPQARPNVLFEAGMAMGHSEDRTVLVEIGNLRPFSDIAGRHTVRLDNSPEKRKELVDCLKAAGCTVDVEGKRDWLRIGDFTVPIKTIMGKDVISLIALDCKPHVVTPGQTLTISYTITSQAASAHEVLLGASAVPPSGPAYSDPSQDKPVILRPGSQTVQRYLTIPVQAEPGNYRLISAVWDMPPNSENCLARMERDGILSVVLAH